jgi:hypothetical protein
MSRNSTAIKSLAVLSVQELSFWKNWAVLSDMGTLLDLSSLIVTVLADYLGFSNNLNSCHFMQGN